MTHDLALENPEAPASRRQAVVAVVVAVSVWALVDFVGSLALHRVSPWQTVFVRYTVHLCIVMILWGRQAPWRTHRLPTQLARSAMMLVMPAAFIIAVTRGAGSAWVMTIFWSAPLQLLVIATVFERERASSTLWFAAVLGWIAAWVSLAPHGPPSRGAIVLGVAMAGSFSLYVAMTRMLRDEPLRTNLLFTAVVPWTALLMLMPRVWVSLSPSEVAAMVFIGVGGLIGLLAIDRFTRAAPVSDTAPMLSLQVGVVMLLTALAGHRPTVLRFAATVGVLGAMGVLAWFGLLADVAAEVV